VFALAPVTSEVFLPGASDFLKNQNVPFTGWGFQPGFCGNPAGFGFNGCLVSSDVANLAILGPLTKVLKKGSAMAFIADNTTSGQSAIKQAQTAADYYGYKMVYSKAILPIDNPVTDFSPYVTAILESHPDLVVTDSGSFANDVGLDGALKAAGYKGPTMNFVTYVPGLLTSSPSVASAINGAYTNIQFAPQEQGGPAVDQIEKDLVAIGQKPLISIGVATSYWSAQLLIAMLKAVGPDLTPATFMKKINGGFTWTPSPAGGVGPLSFPEGHTTPAPCAALVQAVGQVYKSSAPLECYKTVTYSK
jgi:ABC-type branched-subunit amino acid transport system substrate-binding protein